MASTTQKINNSKNHQLNEWHALYVASRQEKKVGELLSEKGIEAYVPLIKTMRQWSDRKKLVELPLMNGYVFVCINPTQNDAVLQTRGVVNFVRIEKKIAVVRDYEIESLKQLIELGYQIEINSKPNKYKEGDKIKITSGALKGIEGFITHKGNGRILEITLESIKQTIKVKLPEEILIPA